MADLDEKNESLWVLAVSPAIWSVHFLLSYITAAIWCGKVAEPGGSLGGARMAIAAYTLLALIGIIMVGWRGWRRHTLGSSTVPHDFDTPEDRSRFLGFATVLLSALSAVGTLYVSLAAAFIANC